MKVLLIVDKLPLAVTDRMRDIYLTAINAHVALGYQTFVVQSRAPWRQDTADFIAAMGAILVPDADAPPPRPGWAALLRDPLYSKPSRMFQRVLHAANTYFAREGPPDVITGLMSTKYTGIPAFMLSQTLAVPFVIWEHLTHYQRPELGPITKRRVRRAQAASDRLFAVSQPLLENIRRCMSLPLPQGRVLPNPIPDGFFETPAATLPDIETFRNGRYLCAGWTQWRDIKRADIFLRAVSQLPDDVCAVIAGPTLKSARRLLEKLNLQDRVLMTGALDRSQIHALAHMTDCCILPSDHETFGMPALEAMAAGKPVVTTASGGPETLISESWLGRVVPRRDPSAIARAVLDIKADPASFPAEKIRAHTKATFAQAAFNRHWQTHYDELLGQVPRPPRTGRALERDSSFSPNPQIQRSPQKLRCSTPTDDR